MPQYAVQTTWYYKYTDESVVRTSHPFATTDLASALDIMRELADDENSMGTVTHVNLSRFEVQQAKKGSNIPSPYQTILFQWHEGMLLNLDQAIKARLKQIKPARK